MECGIPFIYQNPAIHRRSGILFYISLDTLYYVKRHVKSLQKGSKEDQYVFQNLMWSGVYLRGTFTNNLHQKVLTLVPLTSTRLEVFVPTMATFLSDSYDALEETLTQTKSLKLNIYLGENVIYS